MHVVSCWYQPPKASNSCSILQRQEIALVNLLANFSIPTGAGCDHVNGDGLDVHQESLVLATVLGHATPTQQGEMLAVTKKSTSRMHAMMTI